MKVEEKNETNILEEEKTGKLPKEFFEGFANQDHFSSETFMFSPESLAKLTMKPPEAVYIHRLHKLESDKYALRKVLFLQIEKTEDGEAFIAKVPWLDIFGIGETKEEAIRDFELSLIEDYEILKEESGKLGDHLRKHFELLTKVIRELPCR